MKVKPFLFGISVVIAIWIATIVASGAGWNLFGIDWDFSNTGEFGDSFGPLSAAMGAAAAIGAFLAWNEQRKEVQRLRANDEQSKHDLAISRDDQTFFNMIRMFQDVVNSTDIQRSSGPDKRGQDSFAYLQTRIDFLTQHGLEFAYLEVYKKYVNDLGHYFRILYNIIAFVDRSNLDDKYFYIKIVRSMLSNAEIALVGLNCLYGEGREKFKPLVNKYAFLKNLSNDATLKYNFVDHFDPGAFKKMI